MLSYKTFFDLKKFTEVEGDPLGFVAYVERKEISDSSL